MKRSEVNIIINEAKNFFAVRNFMLPEWAYWSPDKWKGIYGKCCEIVDNRLGWDITDFGSGDFYRKGKGRVLIGEVSMVNGSSDIIAYSDGSFFTASPVNSLPVSHVIRNELERHLGGDTTGCGDNFAGGVIASVVDQLINGSSNPYLTEACSWGIVSGGYACFHMGGTYFEKNHGEKMARLRPYYEYYREQISK